MDQAEAFLHGDFDPDAYAAELRSYMPLEILNIELRSHFANLRLPPPVSLVLSKSPNAPGQVMPLALCRLPNLVHSPAMLTSDTKNFSMVRPLDGRFEMKRLGEEALMGSQLNQPNLVRSDLPR